MSFSKIDEQWKSKRSLMLNMHEKILFKPQKFLLGNKCWIIRYVHNGKWEIQVKFSFPLHNNISMVTWLGKLKINSSSTDFKGLERLSSFYDYLVIL